MASKLIEPAAYAPPSAPQRTIPTYATQGRPYDGPLVSTGTPTGGVGGYGITPDVLQSIMGGGPTSGSQASTYATATPGQFGFSPGAIGSYNGSQAGNAVSFMQAAGFPQASIDFATLLQQGSPIKRPNYNQQAMNLGGLLLPSLQSYLNMGTSGQGFYEGLMQTLLGLNPQDLLMTMLAPWEKMRQGTSGSTRLLGGFPTR